ncbi:MAG TPA: ATP-binding protein [Caulobacteraceae bacterium]|nr:ATP-binding protein [Caulobacteraceae bacterium]
MIRLWPFGGEPSPGAAGEPDPSQSRFGQVLEALPEPLMVVRAEARSPERWITFANGPARAFFRLGGERQLLVGAIRRPEVLEMVEESLASGTPGEAAFESQERMLRAFSRPLPASEDEARETVLVVRDETDARRSERMRADFLANASHELRTPLASVKGFIETLRGHAKDDAGARDKFLAIMAAQAERMGRLIEDLMSLSRIELNEHIPPGGKVDTAQVAGDVVDAVGPMAAKSGVRIELVAEGNCAIEGDRDQVQQVIQNLVDNALKYSPAGATVTVEVLGERSENEALAPIDAERTRLPLTQAAHDPDQKFVIVRVSDQGPGIARDQLPRLTERFYRAPGQKTGERSGTGLGLAIVKHIVKRHRGGLAVESAPGKGATFIVQLPMRAG